MNKYVIGVSGGIDSMCLFHILHYKLVDLYCVHINHHTRGEQNAREQKLVEDTCKKYNVKCFVFDFHYIKGMGNFQHAARNFRLECFKDICSKYNLDGIYLGHHRDDLVENIIMNPLRIGSKMFCEFSDIKGLKIIRPLIWMYKEQIKQYQFENNIYYLEDSSNIKSNYYRNNVRINKVSKLSIKQKEDIIDNEIKRLDYLNVELNFEQMDFEQKQYYLYCKVKKVVNSNISTKFINSVINSYTKSGNKSYSLPENMLLILSYGNFSIINKEKICKDVEKITKKGYNSFNGISFYADDVYVVRTKKKNDYIIVNGIKKKINRYFIEIKVPLHLRELIPLRVIESNRVEMVNVKEQDE